MSDMPADMKEQLARIDRMMEESRKFSAEMHKLTAETLKLSAEAAKLDRDRWLAPWLVILGGVGGIVALVQFALRLAGKG